MTAAFLCAVSVAAASAVAAPPLDAALDAALNRVSGKVLDYYQRAQSIVSIETVRLQPVAADLWPEGPARTLVYELRVEWTPSAAGVAPDANIVRRLLTVNGREPRPNDEPGCTDPRAVAPEPLFMLLPEHRSEFGFSLGTSQRVGDRPARTLDYISLPIGSNQPTWKGDCVSIPLEGRTRGRIWFDAETDDVLRLEEHLVGMVDVRVPKDYQRGNGQAWMTLERADYSIQYRPVTFADPDETLVLPASIVTLRTFRGSHVSRVRATQTYSDYRRFLTRSRMIRPAA